MSTTQSGLPLPTELVIHVINCCNQTDSADSPDNLVEKYTVTPQDTPFDMYADPVRLTWFVTTKTARESFLGLRLVCSQFGNAC